MANKEKFMRYVKCQKSGKYNMLDSRVQIECNLTKEEHMYIIKNYNELYKKYIK